MIPRRALHALWLAVVPLIAAVVLTEVTGFGANPGSPRMFLYVPNTVGSPTSTASSWSTRR